MVNVLPVPALASIRLVPARSSVSASRKTGGRLHAVHLLQLAQQRPEDGPRRLLELLVQRVRVAEAQVEVGVFAFTRHLA